MAKADSTVRVNIIGDAKGLQKELKTAEKGIGGLGVSAKGLLAGAAFAGVTAGRIEFGQTALAEADRVGDATARIELAVGDLGDELVATSKDFTKLGLSKQDMLELEARVLEVGTALGVTDKQLVSVADDIAATAKAIELLGGADAATNVDLITKAAGGSTKAYKELGIFIDEAVVAQIAMTTTGKTNADQLTKSELAAARLTAVMDALKPKLDAVALGQGDVESKTAAVQAKFETLQAEIGGALEGPLEDLLDWILSGIDGLGMLGDQIDLVTRDLRQMASPIANVIAGLREILKLAGLVPDLQKTGRSATKGSSGGNAPTGGGFNPGTTPVVNINVAPTGGADMEKAVVDALRDYNRKNQPL